MLVSVFPANTDPQQEIVNIGSSTAIAGGKQTVIEKAIVLPRQILVVLASDKSAADCNSDEKKARSFVYYLFAQHKTIST